jgi:enoyl-CoA hydratase
LTDFPHFHVDIADGVADVVIDKPPVNSLDYELYAELSSLLDVLESNDEVRAVLFRSANEKIFISGADIKDMVDYDRRRGASARKVDTVQSTFTRLQRFSKPTVVAITGHALGGGCEFSLCIDFRVMLGGRPRIGQPEVNLGIMPGGGGSQRLARLVGRSVATEMLMLGKILSAAEAQDVGLIHRVGDSPDDTVEQARELALELSKKAPIAIKGIKRALNDGVDGTLTAGLAVEREAVIEALGTKDAEEGVAAFLEKRDPEWRGE